MLNFYYFVFLLGRGGWKVKVSKLEFLKKRTKNLNSELEPSRDLKGFSSKVSFRISIFTHHPGPTCAVDAWSKHLLKWLVKTHSTLTTVTKNYIVGFLQKFPNNHFPESSAQSKFTMPFAQILINDTQWFPFFPAISASRLLGFSGYLRQRGDTWACWKTRTEHFIWKFKKYQRVSEVRCEFMNYSKSTKKITLNKHFILVLPFHKSGT